MAWRRGGRRDRLGAGREKQAIERNCLGVRERHLARSGVDRGHGRIQAQIDRVVGIEGLVAKRQPLFGGAAGEIVLRQVWAVDRRRIVAAQHDDAALIFLPPQHLGRGEPCCPAADDHNLVWFVVLSAALLLRLNALLAEKDFAVALIQASTCRLDRAPGRAGVRQCEDQSKRDATDIAPYRRQ